jgi:phage tail-like protein
MGEGTSSPRLRSLRQDFDHETYRRHLPAIFSDDPDQAALLDRLLSLYESFYAEAEAEIQELEHRFDPSAAPAEWLPWLAGWLAVPLDQNWSLELTRQAIRGAYESYGHRGTRRGLQEAIRLYAGVDALIEEPITHAGWWALAEGVEAEAGTSTSCLGFTTRLAAGPADGAVLGSTALLDRSYVIDAGDLGAPLFDALAHRVTVRLYRGQVTGPAALERLVQVLEREKPAHVAYQLCVTEPRMRIGFQALLGIDTVVAGPAEPSRLGDPPPSGGLVLGGDPPGRMGVGSRVGQTTRLTDGVLD